MKIRRLRKPEVTREQVITLMREFDEDLVMDFITGNQDPVVVDVFFGGIGQKCRVNIVLNEDKTWDFIRDGEW
jgi:hypothetical protein